MLVKVKLHNGYILVFKNYDAKGLPYSWDVAYEKTTGTRYWINRRRL